MKDIIGALAAIVLCALAGVIGQFFTFPEITNWYAGLAKPFFNPPNWIFGPVWTLLYIMMGIAVYLVVRRGLFTPAVEIAVGCFAIQLVLNSLWSIIFFGQHQLLLAFVEIIFLWSAILLTIVKFWPLAPAAGWLMVPYLCWVSFAAILNFSVWFLNR
jgi:translocator protein